jgi:putative transposase
MARIARIVVPGLPHLVTQYGNFDATLFQDEADYIYFRELLASESKRNYVEIWAWCLLPGRIHLLMTPSDTMGLGNCMAGLSRQYSKYANKRANRRGHLFGSRYSSIVIGEDNIGAAYRYVALSPVRAGLANRAEDWRWSSALANLGEEPDGFTISAPVRARISSIPAALASDANDPIFEEIRKREGIGRPWGSPEFVKKLETRLGRTVSARKRGRKKRGEPAASISGEATPPP